MSQLQVAADSEVCVGCGRCCHGPANYVQVFDEDLPLFTPEMLAKLVVLSTVPVDQRPVGATGKERFMRMENGHCAALDTRGGKFVCSIYAQRPILCRVYKMYASYAVCPPEPAGRVDPQVT